MSPLSDLLCVAANQDNGFRRIPRRVANRYRVRRRDGDIGIHIPAHKEVPERDPKCPRILCVLTAVLSVLAGASDRRSGFCAAYPAG